LLPLMSAMGVVVVLDDFVGEPLSLLVAGLTWWLILQAVRRGRCVLRRWFDAAS
jgi:hypothetical protein